MSSDNGIYGYSQHFRGSLQELPAWLCAAVQRQLQ